MSLYCFGNLMISKILDLPQLDVATALPTAIEKARSAPSQPTRVHWAQLAYRFWGVIIPFRLENGDIMYYMPSEGDKEAWHTQEQLIAGAKALVAFYRKTNDQLPYLFALYAATFAATYSVGWIWLLVKLPRDPQRSTS